MKPPKSILAILVSSVLVSMAHGVTINGIITDTGGVAISGAIVRLENGGLKDTTQSDGRFFLTDGAAIKQNPIIGSLNELIATIRDGSICLNIVKRSIVEITTYQPNGKALSIIQKTMDPGVHSITLPYRAAGIYLLEIKAGNSRIVIKSNFNGAISTRTAKSDNGISSKDFLLKQAAVSTGLNDVIAVTKEGYLNYRASARNSYEANLGIKMVLSAGNVTDVDENIYQTVRIGTQIWTVENLRTKRYNDGASIQLDTSTATWATTSNSGKYCYYKNVTNTDTIKKYGALYNWYAVNTNKLAPAGWHVPSLTEWSVLVGFLNENGYNWDGSTWGNRFAQAMCAKTDWATSTVNGASGYDLTQNNRCGFTALPGGSRGSISTVGGEFYNLGKQGNFWTSTSGGSSWAYYYFLYHENDVINSSESYNSPINYQSTGYSVRLLKN